MSRLYGMCLCIREGLSDGCFLFDSAPTLGIWFTVQGTDLTEAVPSGFDLQARLEEASARKSEERRLLAERLQESVVPLFIGDSDGQPDRIGSCVLVRLDSDLFAFTAAHVIRDANARLGSR
jgi:hypothetical protein